MITVRNSVIEISRVSVIVVGQQEVGGEGMGTE